MVTLRELKVLGLNPLSCVLALTTCMDVIWSQINCHTGREIHSCLAGKTNTVSLSDSVEGMLYHLLVQINMSFLLY